ncbi:MAG: hypothetical protein ABF633_03315 [Clostridium sp.]|uniref:hypothetical protein n=1 Tax=Clostridium sp. TaxID=1506 RepID=UPI0039EBD0B3
MSDNDLLQKILKKLEKLDVLEGDLKEVKADIKEIKATIIDLDPKNANRHIELDSDIKAIKQGITEIKSDLKEMKVVTRENSYDISYLKGVK